MRTCITMSVILVCLSLAALSCQSCEDSTYGAGAERDRTEQTDGWQHPYMFYASMFRVGSGAGPFHPSTDFRSAAATPEGKRMSTSSGFLRGSTPPGSPPSQYWTEHDAPQPDDFSSRSYPEYRAVHIPWTVSVNSAAAYTADGRPPTMKTPSFGAAAPRNLGFPSSTSPHTPSP